MNERAFPIISVKDLKSVRRFYEQLGFRQVYQYPSDGEPGYVSLERGAASIGVGAGGAVDEDRFGIWVYVEDVDRAVEELRSAGVSIVAEAEDQPWGERAARVRDPDGNLVYLATGSPAS
jgi:lactoylglutathione lyase